MAHLSSYLQLVTVSMKGRPWLVSQFESKDRWVVPVTSLVERVLTFENGLRIRTPFLAVRSRLRKDYCTSLTFM
jgi:hypothetical protein